MSENLWLGNSSTSGVHLLLRYDSGDISIASNYSLNSYLSNQITAALRSHQRSLSVQWTLINVQTTDQSIKNTRVSEFSASNGTARLHGGGRGKRERGHMHRYSGIITVEGEVRTRVWE